MQLALHAALVLDGEPRSIMLERLGVGLQLDLDLASVAPMLDCVWIRHRVCSDHSGNKANATLY